MSEMKRPLLAAIQDQLEHATPEAATFQSASSHDEGWQHVEAYVTGGDDAAAMQAGGARLSVPHPWHASPAGALHAPASTPDDFAVTCSELGATPSQSSPLVVTRSAFQEAALLPFSQEQQPGRASLLSEEEQASSRLPIIDVSVQAPNEPGSKSAHAELLRAVLGDAPGTSAPQQGGGGTSGGCARVQGGL